MTLLLLLSFTHAKNLSKNTSKSNSDTSKNNKSDCETIDQICTYVSLNDNKLSISCNDKLNEIDLNEKLGFINNRLRFKSNGNYSQNCSNCALITDEIFCVNTYEISCLCSTNEEQIKRRAFITIDTILLKFK